MKLKDVYGLLKGTYDHWSDANTSEMGAALAYYTAFAVSPLVLIALTVATWIMGGPDAAKERVSTEVARTAGQPIADALQGFFNNPPDLGSGVLATTLAVVVLLFGASGVFGQLQLSLNTLWGVKPKPGRGIKGMLADRFLSFSMVFGTAFLLLVSLVISTALSALGGMLHPAPGFFAVLWQGLNLLVSFAVVAVLFALIFKVLPDATIAWRDVWVGAVVTAVLFTVGKYLLGLYLGRASVTSGFGAAGSLVVILLWVYYSSQILLFGAALTRVYSDRFGSHVRPAANAEPIAPAEQAKQGRPQTRPLDQHQPA